MPVSKKNIGPDSMIYGKVPPQAREVEAAVLGAIMIEAGALERVEDELRPEFFYTEANQKIFSAILSLKAGNQPVDTLTIVQELMKREELEAVGGPAYVTRLTNDVIRAHHIEGHCRIIVDKWKQRELIRLSAEALGAAYGDGGYDEAVAPLEQGLTQISAMGGNDVTVSASDGIMDAMKRVEARRLNERHITGVPAGFPALDRITHGWQPTDFIVLAARPSVGKTAFALQLARNAAMSDTKTPVLFFSLEMSEGQLHERLLASETGTDMNSIQNGQGLTDHDVREMYGRVDRLIRAPLFIDDRGGLTIEQVRAKSRRMRRKHGVGLIIIDYLQLMTGSSARDNREQEISKISRGLKGLAKELKIPVIALSQLSRETEKRTGSRGNVPRLADLRDSGAIEQDADVCMFLYRYEYYGQMENEHGESTGGETHLSILKHRNGSLAAGDNVIKLRAQLNIQKFMAWDGPGPALPVNTFRPVIGSGSRFDDDNPF